MMIATFGEGSDGELYVASFSVTDGTLYRIGAAPVPDCAATEITSLAVPAAAYFGVPYEVAWSASGPAGTFELQESTSPTFATATTALVAGTSSEITHSGATTATFHTRVRAVDTCGAGTYRGPWTATAATVLTSAPQCIVEVSSQTFAAPETISSCGTLAVGPSVEVSGAGVAFRAASRVTLRNGVSVVAGAALAVGIDLSLATP